MFPLTQTLQTDRPLGWFTEGVLDRSMMLPVTGGTHQRRLYPVLRRIEPDTKLVN